MNVNTISLAADCCPKPQAASFGSKAKAAGTCSVKAASTVAQKGLEELELLYKDINMMTFSNAIDSRIRIAKDAKNRLGELGKLLASLSLRSIKK